MYTDTQILTDVQPSWTTKAQCILPAHPAEGSTGRSCVQPLGSRLHLFSFSSMSEVLASLLGMVGAT